MSPQKITVGYKGANASAITVPTISSEF